MQGLAAAYGGAATDGSKKVDHRRSRHPHQNRIAWVFVLQATLKHIRYIQGEKDKFRRYEEVRQLHNMNPISPSKTRRGAGTRFLSSVLISPGGWLHS